MAVVVGFNDITSGERASVEFDFRGGRCGYLVTDTPNTTADWDLEILLPGQTTWKRLGSNADQIDNGKPYDSQDNLPAGRYRLHCDDTGASNYTPVSLFWCYVPQTMHDAALF